MRKAYQADAGKIALKKQHEGIAVFFRVEGKTQSQESTHVAWTVSGGGLARDGRLATLAS